jgi:Putative carbohydrate metabolism domain
MKSPLRIFFIAIALLPLVVFSQQLENPGFENWENAGTVKDEPVDWSSIKTSDDPGISAVAPVTFSRCDTAHSGNYSLRLYNVSVFGLIATGAITNGRFHAEFNLDSSYSYTQSDDPRWHTPFTARPDSLSGWFQFYAQGDDRAQFKVILHVDECKLPANGTMDNWIGMAVFVTEPGVTYDTWTKFTVPFDYYSDGIPEYELSVLNSGDSTTAVEASMLLADDLQLIYPASGISEQRIAVPFLSITSNALMIDIKNESEYLNQWFYLIDVAGQTVLTMQLGGNRVELPDRLQPGVYVAVLKGKSRQYSQKVMVP